MPRTTSVECPGCPPLRFLTTDALGLIKVVESREKVGIPKVVDTWGPPDASRSVITASYADDATRPVLAVARKNGQVELLNPLNGDALAAVKVDDSDSSSQSVENDAVVGLHILKTKSTELCTRSSVLLMCTASGKASLRSVVVADSSLDSKLTDSPRTWDVCAKGKVICSSVHANENYAIFGGKGVEVNMWDLDKCCKTWTAKPPPSNSLGIFTPTWFTAATFLSKEDSRKIVAGTNDHQVRLYDISAQRRPVISINFRESPIKTVTEDLDGYTIYIGTGYGDLASFDMRTGKLLGCFIGKCSGSIRSMARHPEQPVLASCGLDSYLRIWNTKTRQLLSAVFLKQHLTNVLIDSHFSIEDSANNITDQANDSQVTGQSGVEDDEDLLISDGSKTTKEQGQGRTKRTKKGVDGDNQTRDKVHAFCLSDDEDNDELPTSKRKKPASEGKEQRRKHKEKKKNKKRSSIED